MGGTGPAFESGAGSPQSIHRFTGVQGTITPQYAPLPESDQPLPERSCGDAFEDYLHRNGTRILKFFLHLSKEEQRKRLLARADEPEKNWKISSEDLKNRAQWDDFQTVYGECLQHTSHALAPWYSIPADDKRNARLILSQIIIETLRSIPLAYPKPDARQRAEVQRVRDVLRTENQP